MEPTQVRLTIPDSVDPTALMGPADSLLRRIESGFDAMVSVRGNLVSVSGPADVVDQVTSVFSRLIRLVEMGETPTTGEVDVIIDQVRHGAERTALVGDDILLTYRGRAIRPKTPGQKRYVDSIRRNTVTFGLGPAGTGKTYLAMAMAVAALKRREVGRIVLFDMTDIEKGNVLIEQGIIEIAPLAYMRGRTFNNAFVILDEAQNTTPEQMKMFLTRLGFSSTFVVTGDASQRDLPGEGGLESARRVLEGMDDVSFVDFDRNDIVRHALVARIVDAYDRDAAERGHS